MAKGTRTSIVLPPKLVKRIDKLAKVQNMSRSAWIADACSRILDEDEGYLALMTDPVLGEAMAGAMSQPGVIRALCAAMGEELNDKQLRLFGKRVKAMLGQG